ncbi:hypothetical protein [Symbiopectobacterium purcellii]|uniref:hypothetical protein n=1 Tax=Symbiopectobacterium purcellii TaxID=2871826 RepID=UPI003F833E25
MLRSCLFVLSCGVSGIMMAERNVLSQRGFVVADAPDPKGSADRIARAVIFPAKGESA